MATTNINAYVNPPSLTVAQGAVRPNNSYNQRSIRKERNEKTLQVARQASAILKDRGLNVSPQTLANAFNLNQREFIGANNYSQAFGPANYISGDTQQAAARWYSSPTEIADAYQNYYSQEAIEQRTGIKLPIPNYFEGYTATQANVFYKDQEGAKNRAIQEVKKGAVDYYNVLYSPTYAASSLTEKGRAEAEKISNERLKKLYERTSVYFSPDEFNSIFLSALSSENDQQVARWYERNKPTFLDKAIPLVTNVGLAIATGGLSLPQQIGINAATSLVQGAKVEDVLKSIIGTVAASQVPEALEALKATTKNDILNAAIENAFRQGTYAAATGQDIGKAALAGGIGGATVAGVAKASDSVAISRAAGEYTQAIVAGYTPQQAMMSALSAFADTEVAEAKRKLEADKQVQNANKIARTAPIDDAAPYRPQYGLPTAALEGSEIGGKPVTDVPVSQGDESFPKLFDKGDMRRPIGANVSDLYEVKNNLGETFQARDITYQNGEVQRVIFDPATGSYKQQMLKDLPSTGTATMPEMVITGEPDGGVNKAAQVLAFLKPQTKEFGSAIADLPSQDLLDLTNLLAAGTTTVKDSPFSVDKLTNFQKAFSSAEAKAIDLEKLAKENPTPENISAAIAAQNEAITAKFQLSQALIMPDTDLSKADLSTYNKYPEATSKFIEDGKVVYAKGTGAPDSPAEILGSEPYVAPELKLFLPPSLPSASRPASTAGGAGVPSSDLADLQALSLIRGQPVSQSLQMQMKSAKATANDALVALQSANNPETIKAARDALANYELSQKMYTQVAGEEPTDLPDEKLATQEFPLVDEAVKTGQMMGLSAIQQPNVLTPLQRYQQYKRLSGQKEEENYLGDTGLGISVLPRFEGLMEPQMFARGGLTALRRI